MKNELLVRIYQRPQTVFSLAEAAMLVKDVSYSSLRQRLYYAVRQKRLWRPRRGIYTKKDFVPEELANKIYTPSYVSLQTILRQAGIIFQEYKSLFLMSYLTRTITCQGVEMCYQAMPREILVNSMGIVDQGHYAAAIPERAFLDLIFLHRKYHFDNLASLDWNKVFEIVKIYHSPKLEKEVHKYAHT